MTITEHNLIEHLKGMQFEHSTSWLSLEIKHENYMLYIDYKSRINIKVTEQTHYNPSEVSGNCDYVAVNCELWKEDEQFQLSEKFIEQVETIIKNSIDLLL